MALGFLNAYLLGYWVRISRRGQRIEKDRTVA